MFAQAAQAARAAQEVAARQHASALKEKERVEARVAELESQLAANETAK
jgi:hypothetical protein